MKRKILKHIASWLVFLVVLGAGAHVFSQQLRKLLPAGFEEQMQREKEREGRVRAEHALAAGEELVDYVMQKPTAPVDETAQAHPVNLVLRVTGHVSAERGTSVVLAVREGVCPPGAGSSLATLAASEKDQEELDFAVERTLCLAAKAGSPFSVKTVTGSWTSPALSELPQLESAVQALEFTSASGEPVVIKVMAVGYCESEAGQCSASFGAENENPAMKPGLRLHMEGNGEVPLEFSAGG